MILAGSVNSDADVQSDFSYDQHGVFHSAEPGVLLPVSVAQRAVKDMEWKRLRHCGQFDQQQRHGDYFQRASPAATATLPFESRSVAMTNGSFSDTFAAWEKRIFMK